MFSKAWKGGVIQNEGYCCALQPSTTKCLLFLYPTPTKATVSCMYCACWVSTASETQGWENTQRVLFDSAAQTSGFVRVAPNFWGWGVHNHTSLQLLLPMTRVVQALKLKLSSRGLSFCSHQTEISSKKSRFSVRVFCWTRESNTKLPKLLPTKKTSGTRYRHVVKRDEPWSKTGKNANSDSEHLKQMKPLSKGPKRK